MSEEPTRGAEHQKSIKAAFGAENRKRLIDIYFAEHGSTIAPGDAWRHVYQLLLWIDQTTGLAHCYESDKSQPGKRWYARSLAFHDWVANALNTSPAKLSDQIDWLFLRAAKDLAAEVARRASKVARVAEQQRAPYNTRGFPQPGEDPELAALIRKELEEHLSKEPPPEIWARLVQTIRQYLALDNKRKNLVGEGFEDVLAEVVRRTCNDNRVQVQPRKILQEIPGFANARRGDKPNKVDLAIVRPAIRTLVTAKWSVRADREKQFITDYTEYQQAESNNQPFEYVFVTNEFDPARLMRACDKLSGNSRMFAHVVHINTAAVLATYGLVGSTASNDEQRDSMRQVLRHIEQHRLISLDEWLISMAC